MTRRGVIIALHWSVALMLLMMIKGGSAAPALRWSFVAAATGWVGIALVHGLSGRPGPKLSGAARAVYVPMHRALYALLTICAGLNAAELVGLITAGPAWTALMVLLVAATFHAIFHLWRHTTLYDGALRTMTPRALHRYL